MLNRIVLQGNIGQRPETRSTQSGTQVCTFSICCTSNFKNKQTGERDSTWFNIVAWKKLADFCANYLDKGRNVIVDGRLQIRDWTDNNGNKRRSAEIVAENVYFGDSKRDGDNQSFRPAGAAVNVDAADFVEIDEENDQDLPF